MVKLDKYRDPWLAQGFDKYIGFYTREFYCLDNFSAFKIIYNGNTYDTVEHAYQAMGFMDTAPDIANRINDASSPHDAKKIAHENLKLRRSDWDDVKISIMEDLIRCKVAQHPYVKQKLLETKDYMIVEDSPVDKFWGCGPNGDGENNLGKIWMRIREELK